MQITYRIEPDVKTGGFIAYCPVMKPVSIYAKTEGEIKPKMKVAVAVYVKQHPEVLEKLQTGTIEV